MSHARYIGDGVYAQFDSFGVWLTTDSHIMAEARNRIYLEPQVIDDFERYVKDLRERLKAEPDGKPEQI